MELSVKNNTLKNRILVSVISVLVLVIGMTTAWVNQFLSGAILVAGAVGVYFFTVHKTSDKNYLDFVATFSAVWIATIGLAQLRLLDYQKIWEIRTWINLILSTVCFQIGIPFGHKVGQKILDLIGSKTEIDVGRIRFQFKKQRLFWICLVSTAIAVALFVWNILIKGYVPFFSTMFNAYAYFYTRRMVFVTAACAVSPIAYWCIKKGELAGWQKACMYACIAINTFIIPILQVNRGVFVVAALMLTAPVFFLNGKKFLVLLMCLVVTFGFYEVGSVARNYTNEYLNSVFEPTQFDPIDDPKPDQDKDEDDDHDSSKPNKGTTKPSTSTTKPQANNSQPNDNSGNGGVGFKLPAKLSFLYGYFTVSHDNFNEAVANASRYSYGVRQLAPFNVILRSGTIDAALSNTEYYTVKPDLNTSNLISSAYYDLRELGVSVFVLLWGLILGAIEMMYLKHKGVFALAAMGNCLTPVVFCFFSPWFENFTLWLFWGTILLFMFFACVHILPKTKKC